MKPSISKVNKFTVYFSFIVWPAFATLLAIINFRSLFTKNIIWFFSIFVGYTILLPSMSEDHDLVRYQSFFESLTLERHVSFKELFFRPFQRGLNSDLDIYLNTVNILVSRVTTDFRILLVILSIVYGYFFSRNLTFIVNKYQYSRIGVFTVLCLAVLALLYPVWGINGYRFNTAAMVFIFGLLNYYSNRKRGYLLIMLLTPLVHFSFLFPLVILGVYKFIGNKFSFYMILIIFSIFFTNTNPLNVYKNATLAPVAYQNKIKGYTEENYVNRMAKNVREANWYVLGHMIALKFFASVLLLVAWINRKVIARNQFSLSITCFGAFLFSISLYLEPIPALERFIMISVYIIICGILVIHKKMPLFENPLIFLICFLSAAFFIIVKCNIGMNEIGLNTILLNPFIAPFFEDSPALIDFIK